MSIPRESIKLDFKKKSFTGKICVYNFMDHGHTIAYIPSLNLTGYGDTKQEAHDLLMNAVVKDFLDGLFSLKEHAIEMELKKWDGKEVIFFQTILAKRILTAKVC